MENMQIALDYALNAVIQFGSYQRLAEIVKALGHEQYYLLSMVYHNGNDGGKMRLNGQQLLEQFHNASLLNEIRDDLNYSVKALSAAELAEVIQQEKVDAEIAELEQNGICGPFYFNYNAGGFSERAFIISPDEVVALAEEIKAHRNKKA